MDSYSKARTLVRALCYSKTMYALYASKREPLGLWQLDDDYSPAEPGGSSVLQDYSGFERWAMRTQGSTSFPLVAGAKHSLVVSETEAYSVLAPVFGTDQENRAFCLEAWVRPFGDETGPQRILSHPSGLDGLIVNGTQVSFVIEYLTAPDAICTFDLGVSRTAHVVGMYNREKMSLLVDGVEVDVWEFTEEQMNSKFAHDIAYLYGGTYTSPQKALVNGIALYTQPSPFVFQQNFAAGRRAIPQEGIAQKHNGAILYMNGADSDIYIDTVYDNRDTFNLGVINNVAIDDEKIVPVYDLESGVSEPGTWTCGIGLDLQDDTSVYGATVMWSGTGVTVEGSVDGETWVELQKGELVPMFTPGSDPTGVDLEVRVTFAGGSINDYSYLESLRIMAFRDVTITSTALRSVTTEEPAVPLDDSEPIHQRFDNGVRLNGGTVTIGADTASEPEAIKTLELFVKNDGSQPTISFTGTTYQNGVAGSIDIPDDHWVLIHIVNETGTMGSITISGDVTVGQATLYENALTASEMSELYRAYSGYPKIRIEDSSSINASSSDPEATIYGHTWSIKQG